MSWDMNSTTDRPGSGFRCRVSRSLSMLLRAGFINVFGKGKASFLHGFGLLREDGQIIDDALQLQSRAELDACKLATKGGTTL